MPLNLDNWENLSLSELLELLDELHRQDSLPERSNLELWQGNAREFMEFAEAHPVQAALESNLVDRLRELQSKIEQFDGDSNGNACELLAKQWMELIWGNAVTQRVELARQSLELIDFGNRHLEALETQRREGKPLCQKQLAGIAGVREMIDEHSHKLEHELNWTVA